MSGVTLDEDSIDEIFYLARVNETAELETFLSELSTKTSHPKADLIAAAVDPYSKNTALHYAAANGHTDVITLILSHSQAKASTPASRLINATNDSGNTALHWAALNGHLEGVKLLIEAGADVTIINTAGHDAVFEAEINDKADVVDWLLGAVEELETGVSAVDETSADADADAGQGSGIDTGDNATKDSSHGAGEGSGVEDVRRQMERLKAKDEPSQAG